MRISQMKWFKIAQVLVIRVWQGQKFLLLIFIYLSGPVVYSQLILKKTATNQQTKTPTA